MSAPGWLHEPILKGAGAALDPVSVREDLQSVLFGEAGDWTVDGCEIDWARYRPHEKLQITYRLRVRNRRLGDHVSQWVSARVYPAGESSRRHRKARIHAPAQVGRALGHVPEHEMVLWGFPNDRKLESVGLLLDAGWMKAHALPALGGATFHGAVRVQLVRYVSEHTCTVRVLFGADLSDAERVLYAKVYFDDEGSGTFDLMRQLWASESRRSGRLVMAESLGYLAEAKMLCQVGLPGRSLAECDIWDAGFHHVLRSAARALAALHRVAVVGAPHATIESRLDELDETVALLERVDPVVAARCASLVERLRRAAPNEGLSVTLHGDVHLQNFVLLDDRVALIDLDGLRQGSPFHDLGALAASLQHRATVQGRPPRLAEQLAATFAAEYAAHVPWQVDARSLRWHEAAALVADRARRAISRLKGGPAASSAYIQRAEALLASAHGPLVAAYPPVTV